MCLLLFAYRTHPDFPLVIAANRDEFHGRPAAPADWWAEDDILGGRDLEAGGTWFGVNRRGHFAAVTNFRDPGNHLPGARSRGEVVVETLRTKLDGHDWLRSLEAEGGYYNGFNLLFGSAAGVFSFSNRSRQPSELTPGLYGLSNHLLETPWPKVQRGKAKLEAYLRSDQMSELEPMIDLLSDREAAPEDELPATGIGVEWERLLSSMFIVSAEYGTRASTAVLVHRSGEITFMERAFNPDGEPVSERQFRFQPQQA